MFPSVGHEVCSGFGREGQDGGAKLSCDLLRNPGNRTHPPISDSGRMRFFLGQVKLFFSFLAASWKEECVFLFMH